MTLNWHFLKITLIQRLKNYWSLAVIRLQPKKEIDKPSPLDIQQEKLKEIGSCLKKARLEQKLKLESVSLKIFIPYDTLQAVEEGNLEQLPQLIYIKNIIKRYGDFLNVEIKTSLEEFYTTKEKLSVKPSLSLNKLPNFHLQPIHFYVFYIILVIFSVQKIANTLEQSVLVVNNNNTNEIKNPAEKPVIIHIKLKEETWLKVIADDQTKFEGKLPPGTQRTWIAQKQLTLSTGNAGGILVTFNKEKPKQLGKSGEKQEITYNKTGRKTPSL